MQVDVIILMVNGIVKETEVILNETTAEATFDNMLEKAIKEYDLDEVDDISDAIDYGFKLDEVNRYLKSFGMEFIWSSRVEVNEYDNDEDLFDDEIDENEVGFSEHLKELLKLGVIYSNDMNGKKEFQRIDNPQEYADNTKLDFIPPQLASDEDAKLIAKFYDNIERNAVLTLAEYAEMLDVPTDELPENYDLQDIQNYMEENCDTSFFDYPISELEDVIENINESVVLVYAYDEIRVCECFG